MTALRRAAAFGLTLLALAPGLRASLAFTPANPRAGDTVQFVLNPSSALLYTPYGITWRFGDGTTQTTSTSQLTLTHAYAAAGAYSASALYYVQTMTGAASAVTDYATVIVLPPLPKSLTYTPLLPSTCQTITFQASNFTSTSLRWDFGDGTVIGAGGATQTHAYAAAGTYLVQVFESGAATPGATASVTATNRRSISASPSPAKTNVLLAFQASGFGAACVRWNFGDGTIVSGTALASHAYKNPGTYLVAATDDCGNAACGASLQLPVTASGGPLAPFAVTSVRLRFENGATNVLVGKGTSGLAAFLDLKFEGTGFLQVEWLVDGVPVRTEAVSLAFADSVTLSSGGLPGLPTAVLGPHTVSLAIVRPAVAFTLPTLTYYVAAAENVTPAGEPPPENAAAPLIRRISPDVVERGKEYRLKLEGLRLTEATVVTLAGVGVKSFSRVSPELAWLDVFVPVTAKEGERPAVAANDLGRNTGPARLTVAKAPGGF